MKPIDLLHISHALITPHLYDLLVIHFLLFRISRN